MRGASTPLSGSFPVPSSFSPVCTHRRLSAVPQSTNPLPKANPRPRCQPGFGWSDEFFMHTPHRLVLFGLTANPHPILVRIKASPRATKAPGLILLFRLSQCSRCGRKMPIDRPEFGTSYRVTAIVSAQLCGCGAGILRPLDHLPFTGVMTSTTGASDWVQASAPVRLK